MSYEKKKKALSALAKRGKANRVRESGGFGRGEWDEEDDSGSGGQKESEGGVIDWLKEKLGNKSFAEKFDKNRRRNPKMRK